MAETIPYRPSNGTEGIGFEERWCDRCELNRSFEDRHCPIWTDALAFALDDPEYPDAWVSDADGCNPRCTAFMRPVPAAVWEACVERCADIGDPGCREVKPRCMPCRACCEEAGYDLAEPLDPAAVVRPLL